MEITMHRFEPDPDGNCKHCAYPARDEVHGVDSAWLREKAAIEDENILSVGGLIADLRGGVPDSCSFCGKATKPEDLHPEEAGEWACIECIKRWRKKGEQY